MLALSFRNKVKEILTPLGKALGFLEPNHITFFSLILVSISAFFFYTSNFLLAFLFFILSSFMDALDGLVAKTNNKRSDFGNYFDAMTDRIHEFIIMLSFAFSGYAFPAFLAFSSSLLISYSKARAEMIKPLGNIDWPSIGERVERLLLLSLMLLLRIFTPVIYGYDLVSSFLYLLFALSFIGLVQRMLFASSLLKS